MTNKINLWLHLTEEERISSLLEEQNEQQMQAAAARAQMEADEKNLSEKQAQKLLKHYQQQAKALNKSLANEKDRQLNALKERMRLKKEKKGKNLDDKQKVYFILLFLFLYTCML